MVYNRTIIFILFFIGVVSGVLLYKKITRKARMQGYVFTKEAITTPNGIELYTESFGNQSNPACLLIAGAMAPARFWIDEFCQQLADAGYFVIRYDHSDMGLSSAIDYAKNPYTLNDLAKDAIGILDAYNVEKAHLIGHSMGGAIAQLMALDYPDRCLSITLISSSVLATAELNDQEKEALNKTWKTLGATNKPTRNFIESVDGFMKSYEYLHGDIHMDKDTAQVYIKDMYERSRPEHIEWFEKYSSDAEPMHNHVKAQQNIVDRTQDLKKITVPVLVIHGQKDALVFPRVVQKYCIVLIPNAKIKIIPGMGHMLFNLDLLRQIGELILKHLANKQLSTTHTYSHEIQQQLKDSLELLKMILGPDLLGVYLFGSSLVGGLQKYSDIDLFVVTNRVTTLEEKTRLISSLLKISGIYMKGSKLPIEMTIVEKTIINPWHYPPRFDFQYGEWLRKSFEKGIIEPWQTHEMPDLALIVTQVLLKNQTLWGLEPEQLLAHVPYNDFIRGMTHNLNSLGTDLEHDTRNVLLTYARIWSTLETNAIRSKPDAADWVINRLPEKYRPVMERAKAICKGEEKEHWDDIEELIRPCTDFMVDKINAQISLINFDDPNKLIRLAEEPFPENPSLRSQ